MRRLSNSAKGRDQYRADADEDGAREGVTSKGFTENEGRKDRIEYQARLLNVLVNKLSHIGQVQ